MKADGKRNYEAVLPDTPAEVGADTARASSSHGSKSTSSDKEAKSDVQSTSGAEKGYQRSSPLQWVNRSVCAQSRVEADLRTHDGRHSRHRRVWIRLKYCPLHRHSLVRHDEVDDVVPRSLCLHLAWCLIDERLIHGSRTMRRHHLIASPMPTTLKPRHEQRGEDSS